MGLLVAMALLLWGLVSSSELFFARGRWWDDLDAELLGWVVELRFDALTDIARFINSLTNDIFLSIIRWIAIAAMLANKRWRHLGVFVVVILSAEKWHAAQGDMPRVEFCVWQI